MNKRLEHAEVVCNWLNDLLKQDCSPDLLGRALRDAGSKLVSAWHGTITGSTSIEFTSVRSPRPGESFADFKAREELRLDPARLKIENGKVVERTEDGTYNVGSKKRSHRNPLFLGVGSEE